MISALYVLRQAMDEERMQLDELSNLYLRKYMNKFWQIWRGKFIAENTKPSTVNGLTTDDDIANCFSGSVVSDKNLKACLKVFILDL